MKKKCSDHLGNEYVSIEEMCSAYGIKSSAYWWRITNGWSIEKALTTDKQKPSFAKKKSIDHLGNEYDSIKEMCAAYGINHKVYWARIKQGWSLKDALTEEKSEVGFNGIRCADHLGRKYCSISEMCRAYGADRSVYQRRIDKGWSIKDALTLPYRKEVRGIECTDPLGNKYNNVKEMCEAYNIKRNTYESRIRRGYTVEEALGIVQHSNKVYKDHKSNEYGSIKEMCSSYGISTSTFNRRIKLGWDLKSALTEEVHDESWKGRKCRDHLGNLYSSVERMCMAYGIDESVFRTRIRLGWSLEDALKRDVKSNICEDHLGNRYRSTTDM